MQLSPEEISHAELSTENLTLALRLLRECGYVVLEKVLPDTLVNELREGFDREHERVYAGRDAYVREVKGHCGVGAPMEMPYLDPLIVSNPFALQIMEAAMGKKIWAFLPYHCNTTWPGSEEQHIHRDTGQLFPELPYVLPMALAVVNVPLIDFTDDNGSTEVWPGTHLIADHAPGESSSERLAERAVHMPSVRTNMPAGSVVVRDMRVWHRGMPNRTDRIRTMISLVYFRQFHRLPDSLVTLPTIPASAHDLLTERGKELYRYNPIENS